MTTSTLTKAEAIEALELYGQHHPDCAAMWPEKPCDCGLAALGVDVVLPPIDRRKVVEDVMEVEEPRRRQIRRGTTPAPKGLRLREAVRKSCSSCGETFEQQRRQGRPFSKCEACR